MSNDFTREFISRLEDKLSTNVLKLIHEELELFIYGYDIKKKDQSMIVYRKEAYPNEVKIYLVSKKLEGKSSQTIYGYKNYLKDFFERVSIPIVYIKANDIRRYLYEVQNERNISNRSLDTRRRVLNGFFQWLFDEGYITKNPMKQINPIKFTSKEREPLTDEQLTIVRDACDGDPRCMALLEVMYSTGARVSEIANLKKSDINLVDREVILFGKGSKYRTSYLSGRAVVELKRYWKSRTDDNEYAFVQNKEPYGKLGKRGIEKVISNLGERAGIHLYPHRIRHTSATDALARGMKLEQVQQLLGHSKPETTEIYAKLNNGNVKNAHRNALI